MPARHDAPFARFAWIAIALLVWVAVVPALHASDHADEAAHAEACPYCHPAQSTSFVPVDAGTAEFECADVGLVAPAPVGPAISIAPDPWYVRGPPVHG